MERAGLFSSLGHKPRGSAESLRLSCWLVGRYDTDKRALEFLNPLPEDFEERCGKDTDFLGPYPFCKPIVCTNSCLPGGSCVFFGIVLFGG